MKQIFATKLHVVVLSRAFQKSMLFLIHTTNQNLEHHFAQLKLAYPLSLVYGFA